MYEFLVGELDYISTEYIVVEVNGIGYRIICPNPFAFEQTDTRVKVYTYHYVRDDASLLYGFKTREEKALFTKLLSVSGIGPKGGLAILATGEPQQVIAAIEQEDESFLMQFPGVGKKTARQMILDLKGKLDDLISPEYIRTAPVNQTNDDRKALTEAIEALRALGYAEREITKITPQLKAEQLTTDAYIKKALQLLIQP